MAEIEEIYDIHGETRRLGSLLPPKGFVSAFKTWESEKPIWEDDQIKRVITDPNRVAARDLFGPEWILNQFSHGSCNGFGGAGAFSKARYRRGLTDKTLFSGAFLYSLINGGRDQGSALEDGLMAIQKYGICPQSLVDWKGIYPHLQPKNAREEALKHRGLDCWAVESKQGFRTAVAAGFPVIVAVHAGSRYQKLNDKGIAGVDNGSGNHATHVDDMKIINGTEVYDQPGSWGLSYGEQGRSYLTWDSFAQTFGNHTFYAIGSTLEE
jgi:hypothetical protein